jgi:hypothetical protein
VKGKKKEKRKKKEQSYLIWVVAHACHPRYWGSEEEDYYNFEASLGNLVRSYCKIKIIKG